MLNVAQRLDLMKLSADLAKAEANEPNGKKVSLATAATEIFATLKAAVETGSVLDDTDMGDVKSAVDVASEIEAMIEKRVA